MRAMTKALFFLAVAASGLLFANNPTTQHTMLDISVKRGEELLEIIPDIAKLRIEVFAEWPYRYEGDLTYEEKYVKKFAQSEEAFCVVAKDGDKVVGVSTALPLKDEEEKMQLPFREKGYDVDTFFYLSDTVLQKEYRGQGIGGRLVQMRMLEASLDPRYTHLCVASIERDDVPEGSCKDLSQSRRHMGFVRDPDLVVWYDWKEIGDEVETPHPLIFWIKPINKT
ncbi:MAG: hypothetical protein SP1CHLAM54_03680 [Chlamydiia bacterium]|nr:hypothetical protein [Chlamydiia bacterium]MCH9615284.1 hypothetical protein [Chlamydiia bacterium]MCH9628394.1 hypothetical protein [Chlamydiia bacterium]